MLNQLDKSVLKKIAESQLITKSELKKYIEFSGSKDAASALEGITRRLLDQRLISAISTVGSTCYIITQKGNQFLKEYEI